MIRPVERFERAALLDILKERYEYEQFRRNNFDNIIGLPVSILALLVGALSAIAFQSETSWTFQRFGALVSMALIGISIGFLIRVFYGVKRKYSVLPSATVIREQYDKLHEYHRELNPVSSADDLKEDVDLSFQEDLIKWYTESASVNCQINDRRAEWLHTSKLWLILSLSVVFLLVIHKTIYP